MNRKYFNFLLKDHKIAVLFFGVLFIGISLTPFIDTYSRIDSLSTSLTISFILALMLTYALPILLLAFIHRKRSVDLYLSLPIRRSEQITTILLFAFCVTSVFYLGAGVLQIILSRAVCLGRVFQVLLLGELSIAIMLIFNSLLYLIGNNLFDSVVIAGAYTVLPFLLLLSLNSFSYELLAGYSGGFDWIEDIYILLSPASMLGYNVLRLAGNLNSNVVSIRMLYLILPVIIAALSVFGLKKEFVERKSERAEQLSDGIFAYPMIINAYAFLILLMLAAEVVTEGFKNMIFFYLLLLFVYVVAMFIYRREIKFKLRSVIGYIIGTVISLALAFTAWNTHFFGLADKYEVGTRNYLTYNYSITADPDNLGKSFQDNKEPIEVDSGAYIFIEATIPTKDRGQYEEQIGIMNKHINEAIDRYYRKEDDVYQTTSISLNNRDALGRADSDDTYYFYRNVQPLSEEELLKLAEKFDINVETYDKDEWKTFSLEEYLKERGND
ncbi:MAG: hypothetical protein K6F23_11105 [Solobacterium sp.]|nr:hypothetical protein [Solobacterium sp.]